MRIENHPILEFNRGKEIKFYFNGDEMLGYESDTVASALHAAEVRVLGESIFKHRPRGFYCAIGNCSSCLMIVDGEPNVRTCITPLKEGMKVEYQKGKGEII
ncbi:MAG: (2Fe-2S)-binding protein [Bacillota bacterium]|nr:(2Fe-2S)-binding protein [Bacillota bacterium]